MEEKEAARKGSLGSKAEGGDTTVWWRLAGQQGRYVLMDARTTSVS